MAAVCLTAACGVMPAHAAEPAAAVAAAFGARQNIRQISLSPDGSHVAVIMTNGTRDATLAIGDLKVTGPLRGILRSSGDTERLTDCHWSTDTRLVCNMFIVAQTGVDTLGYTRSVAVDSDGQRLKLLTARPNDRALGVMQNGGSVIDWTAADSVGAALMTRMFVPENSTGTHLANSTEGLGVDRVDTLTLQRKNVEPGRHGVAEYISDGRGVVRVMGIRPSAGASGYDSNRVVYSYRKPDSRTWLPMGTLIIGGGTARGFNPYAVDPTLNVVYGFDDKDGRQALYKLALDGSLKRELVLDNPQVDVDDLIRIGRQARVVGASYATERRETAFFDPELRALGASLRKALPGQPIINFVDSSADEKTLLVFAGSDRDPGRYYVLDKATRHMAEVLPVRPQLLNTTLAEVKPVRFPAADGTMIPGYLTLPVGSSGKGLPAIVMPHGGPGSRDEWGFDWLSQYFAARGFAVLQPNFRGSTGYGSAWFQKNGFQSWRTAIGDVNDAGRWLESQGIADPAKLAIVGWSYGGYAALQSAVLDPTLFKAIVAIAPVTDLETLRGESDNFTNHAMVDAFIGHGPHVREGSPARNAERITAPVLMFHADRDLNVGIGESRLMASKLKGAGKQVELIEFHGLDHQIDDDAARATMLEKADGFLRTSMKM